MSPAAALWFLPFTAPIALYVAWSDMKSMKIPNKAVYTLVAVFAVVGLIALPLETYMWRWLHLAAVLLVGFVMATAGLIGAGDAKFAAAMAPFVALGDAVLFCYLFSAVLLAGFVTHRAARRIPAVVNALPDWESWHRKKDFPMGLALGAVLVIYLALLALRGA
ncbi:MAG: prepilin peptidase [Paracoccaceae bacterium]